MAGESLSQYSQSTNENPLIVTHLHDQPITDILDAGLTRGNQQPPKKKRKTEKEEKNFFQMTLLASQFMTQRESEASQRRSLLRRGLHLVVSSLVS